jgi:hypothetical protein
MLVEKNTLFGLSVLWLTGCSAVSPGHLPFCARASISVPGAPASSLVTGSQVLALNPGVEICAPVCVATALLCTSQPPEPRSEMSLAPVSDGELGLTATAWAGVSWSPCSVMAVGTACALDIDQASAAADRAATAKRTERGKLVRLIAGHSCPAAAAATEAPRHEP